MSRENDNGEHGGNKKLSAPAAFSSVKYFFHQAQARHISKAAWLSLFFPVIAGL
jgi:hypothetical protein